MPYFGSLGTSFLSVSRVIPSTVERCKNVELRQHDLLLSCKHHSVLQFFFIARPQMNATVYSEDLKKTRFSQRAENCLCSCDTVLGLECPCRKASGMLIDSCQPGNLGLRQQGRSHEFQDGIEVPCDEAHRNGYCKKFKIRTFSSRTHLAMS